MKLKPYEPQIKQMVDNGISATKIADVLFSKYEVEVSTSAINRLILRNKWTSRITQGRRNR